MRNILLYFSFKGMYFCGSQRQKDLPTVQKTLEDWLAKIFAQPVKFTPCSRLDRGVNARKMAGNFKVDDQEMGLDRLHYVLNRLLPPYLRILEVKEVAGDFNARFDATGKTYAYQISLRRQTSPFDFETVFCPYYPLDLAKMERAAPLLVGTHDFRNFASPEAGENTVQTVEKIELAEADDLLIIRVCGKKFLRYQVRYLVGSLLDIGAGRICCQELASRLADSNYAGPRYKAPAHALFLEQVEFDFARSENV